MKKLDPKEFRIAVEIPNKINEICDWINSQEVSEDKYIPRITASAEGTPASSPKEVKCEICKKTIEDGTTFWTLRVHPNCGYLIKYPIKSDYNKEIREEIEKLMEEKWYKDGPDCDKQTLKDVLDFLK